MPLSAKGNYIPEQPRAWIRKVISWCPVRASEQHKGRGENRTSGHSIVPVLQLCKCSKAMYVRYLRHSNPQQTPASIVLVPLLLLALERGFFQFINYFHLQP